MRNFHDMNKKLGIIGCQSKHAEFFGSLFNVDWRFPGYRVEYIFADDEPERMPYVLDKARIPNVCRSVDELIELSDAVLITTRLAQTHYAPAMRCIRHDKPFFIDKPFTLNPEEALEITTASIERHIPVLTALLAVTISMGVISPTSALFSLEMITFR
jgi:predicted dehydrogenase